jgi:hypothetical protein
MRTAASGKTGPHDDASHAADAFLTFACSGYQSPEAQSRFNRALEYRD